MSKKHVLVTGGAGFIGSNIARYHIEKGDKVRVIDNLQTGSIENIETFLSDSNFQFDHADLRSWPDIHKAVKWADRIYHMAADVGQYFVIANPLDTLLNNIKCFERILQSITETGSDARILLASTSELYGHSIEKGPAGTLESAEICFPSGKYLQQTYSLSKLVDEVMALSYANEKGIFCTIARIFNTIGINQSAAYGMVVPKFIEQALSGNPITIFGDGSQTRSFCDVQDTVEMLSLLIENPQTNREIVNVGNDHECSIHDLALLIKKLTGSQSEIRFIPYKKAYGMDFQDIKRRLPDLHKLKKLTGFTPKKSLEESLKKIIQAVKNKNPLYAKLPKYQDLSD